MTLTATLFIVLGFVFQNCSNKLGVNSGATNSNLSVGSSLSWTANRESAVNKQGGGYRVYYSKSSGVSPASAPFLNVPYVSGSQSPTSVSLSTLGSGTYYIVVVAYSALSGMSGTGPSLSAPSAQIAVTVP